MNKYITLAKKLKALAENGVGGEKYNAERQLKKLMVKHGFTLEDIEGEKKDYHYFKVSRDGIRLFGQVAATVIGKGYDMLKDRTRKGFVVIETTVSDAIEIESKFDFYFKAYKKELDAFYLAFITANNLFPKDGDTIDASELSAEEIARIKKAQKMAAGMEAQSYLKRLSA